MQVILTMVFVKETRWMATLEELRGQLDVVDNQIVKLYEERMKICEQVGEYKVEAGRKVFDRVREKEKLQNVASKVSSDFDKKGIQELYQQLMSMSRKLQYQQLVKAGALGRLPFIEIDSLGVEKARVVFQGMEGAYGQAAMKTYFGEDCNSYSVRTFRDAMEAIEEGAADYAVLPIENSTAGPVGEFVHTFENISYEKIGVYVLPIHHCMFKKPGVDTASLKEVASHPQALRQTVQTRKAKFPNLAEHEIEDTAIGAEMLAKGTLPETTAAICSAHAGKLWNLEMIAENIEDSSENRTTFWLLKLA